MQSAAQISPLQVLNSIRQTIAFEISSDLTLLHDGFKIYWHVTALHAGLWARPDIHLANRFLKVLYMMRMSAEIINVTTKCIETSHTRSLRKLMCSISWDTSKTRNPHVHVAG